jgi:hypothetical protein
MVLPVDDVAAVTATQTPRAIRRFAEGEDVGDHENTVDLDGRNGVPTTSFFTRPKGGPGAFPKTFTTYVLHVTPRRKRDASF